MLNEKMLFALNQQIKEELFSAYLYLSMSNWFETIGLKGFANWMMVQFKEELDHALKIYKYIQFQGEAVELMEIPQPPSQWESPLHAFEETLKPYFKGLPFNIAEENLQARARGVILMGLSNKFGYILLNTSNKSEAAVGYGTLYGDMNGGLSVLGDVYKTKVFELARYINKDEELIPENIITKPPSAELRPDQKDSDSLPDYNILDKILYLYIEERKGPKEIINEGFEPELVKRVLKMVNTNQYKRYQTPPILRVTPKAFGMGRRMPIVAKYLL